MLTALIFVISAAMLGQFALCFWRAGIREIAAQPVSGRVFSVGAILGMDAVDSDFFEISAMSDMCPAAGATAPRFLGLRTYCSAMQLVAEICNRISMKPLQAWARCEVVTCARYLAVQMEMRLGANQALLAEIRSY